MEKAGSVSGRQPFLSLSLSAFSRLGRNFEGGLESSALKARQLSVNSHTLRVRWSRVGPQSALLMQDPAGWTFPPCLDLFQNSAGLTIVLPAEYPKDDLELKLGA